MTDPELLLHKLGELRRHVARARRHELAHGLDALDAFAAALAAITGVEPC